MHCVPPRGAELSALLVKCTFARVKRNDKKFLSLQNIRAEYRRKKEAQDDIVHEKALAIERGEDFSRLDTQLAAISKEVEVMGQQLMTKEL